MKRYERDSQGEMHTTEYVGEVNTMEDWVKMCNAKIASLTNEQEVLQMSLQRDIVVACAPMLKAYFNKQEEKGEDEAMVGVGVFAGALPRAFAASIISVVSPYLTDDPKLVKRAINGTMYELNEAMHRLLSSLVEIKKAEQEAARNKH